LFWICVRLLSSAHARSIVRRRSMRVPVERTFDTMSPPRKKILLVDDSSTMLLMEQVVLRRAYEVVKATDGAQALRVAAEERPDLILLDVEMPNIDGLEACRLLRAMEATRSTPIIMVTTHGEQATVDVAFANGATDYVTKPIDQADLLRKIRKCLGERSS